MTYKNITVPSSGESISITNNTLNVPDNPIITYIEGDGIGIDITPVMLNVVDAAIEKAYSGERKIHWMEIYAGENPGGMERVQVTPLSSPNIDGPQGGGITINISAPLVDETVIDSIIPAIEKAQRLNLA